MNTNLMHSAGTGSSHNDARFSIETQFFENSETVLPLLRDLADSNLVTNHFNGLTTLNFLPLMGKYIEETIRVRIRIEYEQHSASVIVPRLHNKE